jgi:hypothetical protein
LLGDSRIALLVASRAVDASLHPLLPKLGDARAIYNGELSGRR